MDPNKAELDENNIPIGSPRDTKRQPVISEKDKRKQIKILQKHIIETYTDLGIEKDPEKKAPD